MGFVLWVLLFFAFVLVLVFVFVVLLVAADGRWDDDGGD